MGGKHVWRVGDRDLDQCARKNARPVAQPPCHRLGQGASIRNYIVLSMGVPYRHVHVHINSVPYSTIRYKCRIWKSLLWADLNILIIWNYSVTLVESF